MEIVVELFRNQGEPSTRPIRVRPIQGQFKENYRVWCSVAIRESKPIGTLFRVRATFVRQPHGETYLRIGLDDPWLPITAAEARKFIFEQTHNGNQAAN